MNVVITDLDDQVVAYISDKHEFIIRDGYNAINYGNTEPVFEVDKFGNIYVKQNTWILNLKERNNDMTTITIYNEDAEKLEKASEKIGESIATIIEWLIEENLDELIESEGM